LALQSPAQSNYGYDIHLGGSGPAHTGITGTLTKRQSRLRRADK